MEIKNATPLTPLVHERKLFSNVSNKYVTYMYLNTYVHK